ncbi:endonuclease/exonuclease/phosphatase family protein [Luteolibacter algae]|uniref:Endonuclease/exonuclease/phosphatase family protein n=2 Tax=Luteolibacter algae TaxID=454151 RepID=A0ABW5DFB8_9BACT
MVLPFLSGCEKRQREIPKAVPLSEDGSMELKLMTFNLRYENAEEVGRRAWSERVVGIVGSIREQKPDILGIQEGLHGQVADLRISLPDYAFSGVGRDDGKRSGEYAGIFFNKDRFEKDDGRSGMVWLSDTPEVPGSKSWGNRIPRIATWVLLTDRSSGQRFWAINMHLDHKSQVSREKGVRLMARKLSEMNSSRDPVVWMGDFNAVENNQALRFLSGKSSEIEKVSDFPDLRETFAALHPNESKRGTLHFWMSDPNRQWKVDHIFVSKEASVLEAKIVRSGEPYLSDHFPVTARVRFPPRAAR